MSNVTAIRRGPVLRSAQAAEYVGLAEQTLRKLKHLGEGPQAYKHGSLTVYYPEDLDLWLAKRLVPDNSSHAGLAAAS